MLIKFQVLSEFFWLSGFVSTWRTKNFGLSVLDVRFPISGLFLIRWFLDPLLCCHNTWSACFDLIWTIVFVLVFLPDFEFCVLLFYCLWFLTDGISILINKSVENHLIFSIILKGIFSIFLSSYNFQSIPFNQL